jgi:hypothetical protein
MKTQKSTKDISVPVADRVKKYGVTEHKKNELDALAIQVMDAQGEVEKYQSVVSALTTKSNNLQNFLAIASSNKTQAYNNKILIEQLVQRGAELENNSNIAFNEMLKASSQTKKLAAEINMVTGKLIYSAEVINKLANLIVRQKALNPLISDDLVNMINIAGTDASNAVALTLVALQSTFAAQASEMEAEKAIGLEYMQAITLKKLLTRSGDDSHSASLQQLFYQASATAKVNYTLADKANSATLTQLNMANANLNTAQVKLKSLQSGWAAANAAALAS